MFLIFTALPMNITQVLNYIGYALLLLLFYLFANWVVNRYIYLESKKRFNTPNENRVVLGTVCFISMTLAISLEVYFSNTGMFTHLYWIGLTVLVVLQSSSKGTIRVAMLRMGVNVIGAITVIILMSYFMPQVFWVNLAFLTILLFGIFSFGFSYVMRTLFIELFVLSFAHLLGDYHNDISVDRIVLTVIGGSLVITTSSVS